MFGPFATAAAFLRMRMPLAVDVDQRRIQVSHTTWAKGIAGAEEVAVGDIRSRGLRRKIARADVVRMGLPCQSTSTAGRGRAGADPRD
eukprot:3350775-Alexandrium_andersonii.AAC.1